ncbi:MULTISPECIES: hypothetical protein [Rhodococcus]|uniref:Uncharacterized protein n=1 Tax=Rhodococcus erythropolis TaxID=1833 RepID=A0A8I1D4F0_RHOER|nr:hypothetical protein [Rhodococcus erythropolis]MBH5141167.1 hypothetical protein [Rhodococcus erythropolis]PBI91104.1 hypothetical protein BKP42_54560 [Rhodococcus erythropolis]
MSDDDRQNALADVMELARLLHALRGLSDEVETLLADAMKNARSSGLSQVLIAEAAALSSSRVSQVVKSDGVTVPRSHVNDRVRKISEWPAEALKPYRASFSGRMTTPPYQRRRRPTHASNE